MKIDKLTPAQRFACSGFSPGTLVSTDWTYWLDLNFCNNFNSNPCPRFPSFHSSPIQNLLTHHNQLSIYSLVMLELPVSAKDWSLMVLALIIKKLSLKREHSRNRTVTIKVYLKVKGSKKDFKAKKTRSKTSSVQPRNILLLNAVYRSSGKWATVDIYGSTKQTYITILIIIGGS